MSSVYCLPTEADTEQLAAELFPLLVPATVGRSVFIGLTGGLGAGKTTFVKALLKGMVPSEEITSPTFVLEQWYDIPASERRGKLSAVSHWDLYRLPPGSTAPGELLELRERRALLVLIEWVERVPELLPLLDWHLSLDLPSAFTLPDTSGAGLDRGRRLSVRRGAYEE